MPIEDKVQSLLDVLESDKNYKGSYDYKTLSSDLSDKNKAKELFDVLENDKNYKGSFSNVEELMALKKKEPTTPQGQGILKSGFGESVSGGTKNPDFGTTTIIKEQADKAQKELKTVPPTKENPLGVHPDLFKTPTEKSVITNVAMVQPKPVPESVYKIPTVTSQQIAKKNYDITIQKYKQSKEEAQKLQQELEQSQPELAKIQNDMQAEFQIAGEDIHKTLAPELQQKVNNKQITFEDANIQLKKAQDEASKQIQDKYLPVFAKNHDKYNLYLEKKSDAELQYNRATALEKTTGIIDRNLQAKEISDQKLQFKDIQSTFMAGMYMMNKMFYGSVPLIYRAADAVNYMGEGVSMDDAFKFAEMDVNASPVMSTLDNLAQEQAKLYETKKSKITKTTGTADEAFKKGDYASWAALEGLNFVEFIPTMLAQATIGTLTGVTTSALTPLVETAAFGAQQYYGEVKDRTDMSERQKLVNATTGGALFAMAGHIMKGLVSPMTEIFANVGKEEVQKTIANTISTSIKTGLGKSVPLFKPLAGATEMYALGYSQTWANALTDPKYKDFTFEQIHDEATKTGTSMMGMGLVGSVFGTIPEYIKSDLYKGNNKKTANDISGKIDEIDLAIPTLDDTMQKMMAQKKMDLTGALNAVILKDSKETEHLSEPQKQKLVELNQTGNDIQDLLNNTENPIEGEPRKVLEDNLKQIEKAKDELINESHKQDIVLENKKTDLENEINEINKNAIQKSGTGEILQRQPQGTGSKGSESTGVESSIEGEEVAPKSKIEKVEPIIPKEGDIVELQPRFKGGVKPQAIFKDGKWQAKVGKETSNIGKAAQEEAQAVFESSNKTTLEPKNEVNGGEKQQKTTADKVADDLLKHLGITEEPKGETKFQLEKSNKVEPKEPILKKKATKSEKLKYSKELEKYRKEKALYDQDIEALKQANQEVSGIFDRAEIEQNQSNDNPINIDTTETKDIPTQKIEVSPTDKRPEATVMSNMVIKMGDWIKGAKVALGMSDTLRTGERQVTELDSNGNKVTKTIRDEGGIGFPFKSLLDLVNGKIEEGKKAMGWAAVGEGAGTSMINAAKKSKKITGKELKEHYYKNLDLTKEQKQRLEDAIKDDKEYGLVTIYKMGEEGIRSNEAFAKEAFRLMDVKLNEEEKLNAFKIAEDRLDKIEWGKDGVKEKYIDKLKAAKTFEELEKILNGEDSDMSLGTKAEIMQKIFLGTEKTTSTEKVNPLSALLKEKGISIEGISKTLEEPIMSGIDAGQPMILLAIDPNSKVVKDTNRHANYSYGVEGFPVGLFNETSQMHHLSPEMMDTFVKTATTSVDENVKVKGTKEKARISISHDNKGNYIAELGKGADKVQFTDKKGVFTKADGKFYDSKGKPIKETANLLSLKSKELINEELKNQDYTVSEASKENYNQDISGSNISNLMQKAKAGIINFFENPETTAQQKLVKYINLSFPNVDISLDAKEYKAIEQDFRNKKLLNVNQKTFGVVDSKTGKVYLNPELLNNNTPIHELGHVWNIYAKEYKPEIYSKGLDLITDTKNSKYLDFVLNNTKYQKLISDVFGNDALLKNKETGKYDINTEHKSFNDIKEYVADEALAKAIGDKGELFVNEAQKRNWEKFLDTLYAAIKKVIGFGEYTVEQFQNLKLEDFVNSAIKDILGGKEISKISSKDLSDLTKDVTLPKFQLGDQDSKIKDFIETQREKGVSEDDIKSALEKLSDKLDLDEGKIKELLLKENLIGITKAEIKKERIDKGLTSDEFSKKAAADILGGKGENAPENLKKLAEDNNLPSFRNVVNLVNKYVREVKLEEGKTITDTEVKQALKNKEEGITREGWISKTEKQIERETTGITREQTEQVAKDLGLHDYEAKPEEIADWDTEADKRLHNDPNTIPDLLKRLETGGKTDKVDTRVMLRYMQSLEAKIVKNPSNELIAEYSKARDLKDAVLSKEVAQQLVALKGTVAIEDSLAELLIAKKESSGVDDLTDAQKADVKKMFDELQAAKAEVEDLRKQVQDADNKLAAEDEVKKARVVSKRRTHAEYVAERQDLKEQWSAALKKARGNMGANMPITSEMATIIAKMMKNYVADGVHELSEIINKIHSDISGSIDKDEIRNIIGGSYAKPPKTKNELSAIALNLKSEAALLKKIQDVENGVEPKTEKAKVEKNKRLSALSKQLKELIDTNKRGGLNKEDFVESEKVKELKAVISELEKGNPKEIKNKTPKEVSDEIKSLREQIKNHEATQLNNLVRRNEIATKRIEERIKNKEYTLEKRKSPLDNPEFKKKYPELYKKALDSLHKKEEASRKFELDRYNDEMSKIKWWHLKNGVNTAKGLIATSRAIVAGVDDSFAFVQAGLAMIGNPKEGTKAFKEHILDAFSESRFNREIARVHNSENWNLIHKSGLEILDPASLRKAEHEETFDNNLLKKSITIKGKTFNINKYTLAPFERMFTSLGNHLREYMFLTEAAELMKQGKTFETHPQEFKDIANVINNMTGRAKLPSKIAGAADLMSPIIWSPKLMASSLNILGLSDVARLAGNKGYYTSITGGKWDIKDLKGSLKSEMNSPRRYAIEQTARAIGVGASIMAIAAMNGADVDNDPTSVTFGTIQYTKGGNRYRVWGRFTPYIRMIAMIATGKKTTPRGVENLYGEGKHKIVGEFGQFMRGKFTPLAGEAYSLALNKTYSGETFDYAESAKNLIEPMSLKDVAKGVEQQGMVSLLTRTFPSFIGISVSNEKDFKGKSMIPTQADVEEREQSKQKLRESKKEHLLTQDELKDLSSYMKQNAKQQTQNMSNKQKMDVVNYNAILSKNKKEDIINKRK